MIEIAKPEIILDAHTDMLLDVLALRRRGKSAVLEDASSADALRRHERAVCSLFILDEYVPEFALRNALDQIAALGDDLASRSRSACAGAREHAI